MLNTVAPPVGVSQINAPPWAQRADGGRSLSIGTGKLVLSGVKAAFTAAKGGESRVRGPGVVSQFEI